MSASCVSVSSARCTIGRSRRMRSTMSCAKSCQARSVNEREIVSRLIGEWVMNELKRLDQVAYVRFASVYRRFEDVQAFREEIEKLERDLPAIEGLQLPLLGEVTIPRKKA